MSEPPLHSGELNHALPQAGGPTQSQLSRLCRQDTTSPWSTDSGGGLALPRRCCDVCSAPAYGYARFCQQVTEEIVDYVGQWEKIVDAPVLLRSLDAELGDRFLQVLEQIVEVLEVLPEEIASQLKGWGSEERISERSGEQTVDLSVPQVMESVEMQLECVAEQITEFPVPQFLEERVHLCSWRARAELYAGADCGFPCASVHGGCRGNCASYTTGARAKSYSEALR